MGGPQQSEEVGKLITQAWDDRREDRLNDARQKLSRALALADQTSDIRAQVVALEKLAQVEKEAGDAGRSRSLHEQALAASRQEGDPSLLAYTLRHLGDFHRRAGRLDEAEPFVGEALELYRSRSETSSLVLANAVRSMAVLQEERGRAGASAQLWQEALELYRSVGIEEAVEECRTRLRGRK